MIACRTDLEADIDALVDQLARERKALVPVEALRARLEWKKSHFEDVVAEAEDAGRLQTWEPDGGEMVAILSPAEAESRRLILSPGHLGRLDWAWNRAGTKAARVADKNLTAPRYGHPEVTDNALDAERDGIGFIDEVPDRDSEHTPGLKLNGRPVYRMKRDRELSAVLMMGVQSWPPDGAVILGRQYREKKKQFTTIEVRDIYVCDDRCPTCGREKSAKTSPNCLTCDLWEDQHNTRVRTLEDEPPADPLPKKAGRPPKAKPAPRPVAAAPLRHRLWQ